jgi:hypothetical protein
VKVRVGVAEAVYVVPYQSKLLHENAVVSPVLEFPIVKFNVTTESQPLTFVKVRVGVAEAVYVVPYQSKLLHANTVVSAVFEFPIVKFNVTTESQPDELVPVHVAVLLDTVYKVPCQV